MFFCEKCRVKNHWPTSLGYPFMGHSFGRCEVCTTTGECHDVPSGALTPDDEKPAHQKQMDKIVEEEYRRKAEDLIIARQFGPHAGKMDIELTSQLQQIRIRKNGEINWVATYQMMLVAQQGHYDAEIRKRDRLGR
jgi:hypothetical protein